MVGHDQGVLVIEQQGRFGLGLAMDGVDRRLRKEDSMSEHVRILG